MSSIQKGFGKQQIEQGQLLVQRLEATCQSFRAGMQSLTDERVRLSTAAEANLPPDQRAQVRHAEFLKAPTCD